MGRDVVLLVLGKGDVRKIPDHLGLVDYGVYVGFNVVQHIGVLAQNHGVIVQLYRRHYIGRVQAVRDENDRRCLLREIMVKHFPPLW